MAYKDILVHLDSRVPSAGRLDAALAIAQRHQAHLTALYVIPHIPIPSYAEGQIPAEVFDARDRQMQAEADKVKASFTESVERSDVSGEWRCEKGYTDQVIVAHARYVDLVVAGQSEDKESAAADPAVVDHIMLGVARPVLFIPYIGVKSRIGKRALVAWNGSREAARAVNDALPLLQQADQVDVISVNAAPSEGDLPTADICLHLARHGVKAEGQQAVAKDIEVADVLLSRAADLGTDLIVMGAYGHSRLREMVLGGATKSLLSHMTVPVLMSH